jgi:transcriptional regulator with XRE-family HTH domain
MNAAQHRADVGARLRIAIEALGLTQAAVARAFDVSPSKLGNWVRGDSYPNEIFLVRFCDRYNITMDWLFRDVVSGMAFPLADVLWQKGEASSEASREPGLQERGTR